MQVKPSECEVYKCSKKPKHEGLCEMHYQELQSRRQEIEDINQLLHKPFVDEKLIEDDFLLGEWTKLNRCWMAACQHMEKVSDHLELSEVEGLEKNCKLLAHLLIIAVRSKRKGLLFTKKYKNESVRVWSDLRI